MYVYISCIYITFISQTIRYIYMYVEWLLFTPEGSSSFYKSSSADGHSNMLIYCFTLCEYLQ